MTILMMLLAMAAPGGEVDDGALAGLPLAMSLTEADPPREGPLPKSVSGKEAPEEEEEEDPEQDPQDEDEPRRPKLRPEDLEPPPRQPYRYVAPHGSIAGFFQSHFSSQAWEENVYRDYLTTPSVLLPLSFGAAAGLVSPWDDELQSAIEGSLGHRDRIGNLSMYAVMGGALLNGVFFPGENRDPWDVIWQQGEAYLVTNLLTGALKMAIGRRRPHGDSMRSFPSGHAANAFAAAALIQENSGWGWGAPAYGLAGLTGYSRIEAGRHFPSDVLAGAAIGILTVGILDALHWGNHGEGRGIATRESGPRFDFAFEPGREMHVELGISFGF